MAYDACPRCRTVMLPGQETCLRCAAPRTPPAAATVAITVAPPDPPAPVDPSTLWRTPGTPRRAKWIVVGVVAAIIALGVADRAVQSWYFGPAAAVRAYFSALSEHNATAALRATTETPRTALLSAGALNGPGYVPPSDVTVVRTTTSGRTGTARVRFRIGGTSHTMTVGLRRDRHRALGLFHRWRVTRAYGVVGVVANGATEVRFNGRRVSLNPDDQDPTGREPPQISAWAFPGRYTVDLPDNPLLAAVPRQADAVAVDDPGAAVPAMATRLKPGAPAAVEQQVRAFLDGCAQSTAAVPDGCPFASFDYEYDYTNISSAKWTIDTYPKITVALSGGLVTVSTTADGSATFSGNESEFLGGEQPISDKEPFKVTGQAETRGGKIVFVLAENGAG